MTAGSLDERTPTIVFREGQKVFRDDGSPSARKAARKTLHPVNIAPGQRKRDAQATGFINFHVRDLRRAARFSSGRGRRPR